MSYSISVVFDDGREDVVNRCCDGLDGAVGDALTLADELGCRSGDGHGPPRFVRVMYDGSVELCLTVIRGGLIPKDAR